MTRDGKKDAGANPIGKKCIRENEIRSELSCLLPEISFSKLRHLDFYNCYYE
jgi:hypothetical protein